jgi:hypothetical protein
MKAAYGAYVLAAALGVAGLLVAQSALGRSPAQGVHSLGLVHLIGIDSNMCELGITQEMSKEGFLVTDRTRSSDAVLEVTIQTNGSISDQSSVERARYSAVLVGMSDRVLFATGGTEDAPNLEELCEDIGDEIANQLEARMTS